MMLAGHGKVPEHASIARRQLAIFVGRRERCMKDLKRKYVKDLFTEKLHTTL